MGGALLASLLLLGQVTGGPPRALTALGPTAVAEGYFRALSRGDWAGTAAVMDMAFLVELRASLLKVFDGARTPDEMQRVLGMFPGSRSVDELRRLEPRTLYARVQAGWAKASPDRISSMTGMTYRVVGVVYERTDLAHVVYRTVAPPAGSGTGQVLVMTLRLADGRWWVVPAPESGGR